MSSNKTDTSRDVIHPGSRKTLIGVLAARDLNLANRTLVSLFTHIHSQEDQRKRLEHFHFVFTGGTHDRVFCGHKISQGLTNPDLARHLTWHYASEQKVRTPVMREARVARRVAGGRHR